MSYSQEPLGLLDMHSMSGSFSKEQRHMVMVIPQPVKEKQVQTVWELILFDIHWCAFSLSFFQVDLITPLYTEQKILPGFAGIEIVFGWCHTHCRHVSQRLKNISKMCQDQQVTQSHQQSPWHVCQAQHPLIEKRTFLIRRGEPLHLRHYSRKQCGRLVGTRRQMDGASVVRHQGEYMSRLRLCLFNTMKEMSPALLWMFRKPRT